MNNKSIMIMWVFGALFAVTVCGEYVYLKQRFEEELQEKLTAEAAVKKPETAIDKTDKAAKAKIAVAMAIAQSKNKKIAELEQKLLMTVNYYDKKLQEAGEYDAEQSELDKNTLNSTEFALSGTASFSRSSRKQLASRLETFVSQTSGFMDENTAAAFKERFGAFIATLEADESDIPLEDRKKNTLDSLYSKLDGIEDENMKDRLQKRIDAIEGASEEELGQILSYYQRMDDTEQMRSLMLEFNISRAELRQSGIEPPPRTDWGVDVLEVADNVIAFSEIYKPMIDPEQQKRFEKDMYEYTDEITRWRTDEEAETARRDFITGLKGQLDGADASKKGWLEYIIRISENASLTDVKKHMRRDKMKGMYRLATEYNIPLEDLQNNGAMVGW